MAEETARAVRTVRENVLWYLRRNLEQTAEVQRAMVEKRIERVREKEKSVLYKSAAGIPPTPALSQPQLERAQQQQQQKDSVERNRRQQREYEKTSTLSAEEAASIESQLSPEQLQLFAEENNLMLRHYEETLSKVQYVSSSSLFWVSYVVIIGELMWYYLKKCGKIPSRNILSPTNSRLAPGHTGRIHLATRGRRQLYGRKRRKG